MMKKLLILFVGYGIFTLQSYTYCIGTVKEETAKAECERVNKALNLQEISKPLGLDHAIVNAIKAAVSNALQDNTLNIVYQYMAPIVIHGPISIPNMAFDKMRVVPVYEPNVWFANRNAYIAGAGHTFAITPLGVHLIPRGEAEIIPKRNQRNFWEPSERMLLQRYICLYPVPCDVRNIMDSQASYYVISHANRVLIITSESKAEEPSHTAILMDYDKPARETPP